MVYCVGPVLARERENFQELELLGRWRCVLCGTVEILHWRIYLSGREIISFHLLSPRCLWSAMSIDLGVKTHSSSVSKLGDSLTLAKI